MNRKYWEDVALVHDEKIFDVFSHDAEGVIKKNILKYASRHKTAMDLGCAIGNWLPTLSGAFKTVYAVDISKHYIDLAKKKNAHLPNIEYLHADLAHGNKIKVKADMVVCINTLLTPNEKDRTASYETVINYVKPKGYLVLVVPSLESALYSEYVLDQWDAHDRKAGKKVTKTQKEGDPFSGTILLDGTPTKHYLREELCFMLQQSGFEIEETNKVKYQWDTEFTNPPKCLTGPYPWDWLVVARKK